MSSDLTVGGGGEVFNDSVTGANPVAFSTGAIGSPFTLNSIRVVLSSVGATSESVTVTINSARGATYDAIIDTQNMSGETVFYASYYGIECEVGDSIDVAYPNTDESTVTTILTLGGV